MSAGTVNQQPIRRVFSQQAFADQVARLKAQTDGFDFFALPRLPPLEDEKRAASQSSGRPPGYSPETFGQVTLEQPQSAIKQSGLSVASKPDNYLTLLPLPKNVASRPASNRAVKPPPVNSFNSHSMARKISDK